MTSMRIKLMENITCFPGDRIKSSAGRTPPLLCIHLTQVLIVLVDRTGNLQRLARIIRSLLNPDLYPMRSRPSLSIKELCNARSRDCPEVFH